MWSDMKLTEQQLRFFQDFGFLKFEGLFARDIDAITDAFEQLWAEHGGGHDGKPHDRERRSALVHFIDRNEYLSSLIDDPRLDDIASSILGEDYNYISSDGNFYVGDTRWHSDGDRVTKYLSMKMGFYLDPVTRDSGCLRVIPGSHHVGDRFAEAMHEAAETSRDNRMDELWGINGNEVPAMALETLPGDVLLFNLKIKHSSWGGSDRRRMFTINYEQRYRDEDLPELRERIGSQKRFWVERNYGEIMVKTAGPERMRHLEQRLANDGHMAELARKAREEMSEPSRG